ncbi:MAG: hypothetical protein HDS66_04485 [Bacteroidales bacterium]|nr:hypothetical protein [Bacteroidales bacterium]
MHHTLSVVELHRDDSGSIKSYAITPYAGETPFTTYHDRPLQLTVSAAGKIGFRF